MKVYMIKNIKHNKWVGRSGLAKIGRVFSQISHVKLHLSHSLRWSWHNHYEPIDEYEVHEFELKDGKVIPLSELMVKKDAD